MIRKGSMNKKMFGFHVAALIIVSIFYIGTCKSSDEIKSRPKEYPIAYPVFTTLERTIIPKAVPSDAATIFPYQLSQYDENGYGAWHYTYKKRFNIMPSTYTGASVTNRAKLVRFFSISDTHITDKESPAQGIYGGYKGGNPSGYSGAMLYTTQVLDAAIQTINALHRKNPFDFGIALGDACNSAQYNELRWYIDVIDGKVISPSSGSHAGASTIDYQKTYKAAGLDPSIHWYQVLGNHDHFWQGYLPANNYLRKTLIGRNIINLGNIESDPAGLNSRGFYMGSIDGRTPYGDIIGVGPIASFHTPPTVLAADPDRRILSRNEWIGEFFNSSSEPAGHGFDATNLTTGFACYSFEPKAHLPLKVIVLDDTQSESEPNDPVALGYGEGSYGYAHASLDSNRYNWLVRELDEGQRNDKLMIIAAHIPIGFAFAGTPFTFWNQTLRNKLIAKLHTYPNLILWISGHVHINKITALRSPDPTHPELGFWEVQTASLRDLPQQLRCLEIVRNSDDTISILTTNVDPSVRDGSPAALSRSYAIANSNLFPAFYKIYNELGADLNAHNAELFKLLTPRMQAQIKRCGDPL